MHTPSTGAPTLRGDGPTEPLPVDVRRESIPYHSDPLREEGLLQLGPAVHMAESGRELEVGDLMGSYGLWV